MSPWTEVKNTTWVQHSCMQGHDAFTLLTTVSEDCLYLNVFVPTNASTAGPLPIMLFFYGGSWEQGSATFIVYNPSVMLRLSQDVVVVTANYRLGAFGFLASASLQAQDPDGSTGNYGLQDQRAAMQWIQRNGAAFGGDTKRVTIFGESAGAGSVTNHLVSPRSAGLFHRAIMESGPFAPWSAETLDTAAVKFVRVAVHAGCCVSNSSCNSSDASVVVCLRQLNSTALESASSGVSDGLLDWSPVIDGVDVVGMPEELAAQGKAANVPVMLGTNANEGTNFTPCPQDLPLDQWPAWAAQRYGQTLSETILPYYPPSEYKSPYWIDSQIFGDSLMTCPARRSGHWLSAGRAGVANPADVFVYYFNHTLLLVDLFAPSKGCFHGSELAFVFDLHLVQWTPEERELASAFVHYWVSFAATGTPSAPSQPQWPPFNATAPVTAMLSTEGILTPLLAFQDSVCGQLWDNVTLPSYIVWGH